MKNIEKMLLTIMLLPVFISPACLVSKDHISVRIPVKDIKAVDFKKSRVLLYKEPILENVPENYQPQQEIRDFFLKDVPRYIKKEIEPVNEDTDKTDSLLFSSKMKFDIKDRSVIKKIKDAAGKRKKTFVSVQHWEIDFEVIVSDPVTGKELFKKNYKGNLKDADPRNPEYNFKAVFDKITDSIIKDIMKKERLEQRYLLLR